MHLLKFCFHKENELTKGDAMTNSCEQPVPLHFFSNRPWWTLGVLLRVHFNLRQLLIEGSVFGSAGADIKVSFDQLTIERCEHGWNADDPVRFWQMIRCRSLIQGGFLWISIRVYLKSQKIFKKNYYWIEKLLSNKTNKIECLLY